MEDNRSRRVSGCVGNMLHIGIEMIYYFYRYGLCAKSHPLTLFYLYSYDVIR